MDMRSTTEIANRDVPIEPGEVITVTFSGGRGGKSEAGAWDFWVAFNDSEGYVARWPRGSDPGERFRMMEGKRGYERAWQVASTAKGLRPAKEREVIGWLNSHKKDAVFAEEAHIDGRTLKVVKTPSGFAFKSVQ
jgi:hypothetical protein